MGGCRRSHGHPATRPLCTKAKGGAAGRAVTLETRLWRGKRKASRPSHSMALKERPAPTPTTWSMLVVEAGLDNPALTGFWIRGEPKARHSSPAKHERWSLPCGHNSGSLASVISIVPRACTSQNLAAASGPTANLGKGCARQCGVPLLRQFETSNPVGQSAKRE